VGFRRVIHNKSDLDAILKSTLCAFLLPNLLIEHPVPPDWFDDEMENLDQDDNSTSLWRIAAQILDATKFFAYMLEGS